MTLSDGIEMALLCLGLIVPLFVLLARAWRRSGDTEREFIRSGNPVLGGCAIAMIVVESLCLVLFAVFFGSAMN